MHACMPLFLNHYHGMPFNSDDDNRIVLQPLPNSQSGYINACYVNVSHVINNMHACVV